MPGKRCIRHIVLGGSGDDVTRSGFSLCQFGDVLGIYQPGVLADFVAPKSPRSA
jgi:hypothetical protein